MVSWTSRLQKWVTHSITEEKYMVISKTRKEMVWLISFLREIGKDQGCGVLHTDRQSFLCLTRNLMLHLWAKHIKLQCHYICEVIIDRTLSLRKILKIENSADMLMKVVTTNKLRLCNASVGLQHLLSGRGC